MTLRMEQVVGELPGLVSRYKQQMAAMSEGMKAAGLALEGWAADPTAADQRIRTAMADDPRPFALSWEPPGATFPAPPMDPLTVVAADGSSIDPDRFGPVQCFVINTGLVVLPYGVSGAARLESHAEVGPRERFEGEFEDPGTDDMVGRGWGVNLQRDVAELTAGARAAGDALEHGSAVLLLDGTLLPWDLDSRTVSASVRSEMVKRTRDELDLLALRGPALSLGAYVSGSRSADVVTSLRVLHAGPAESWPLSDAQFFGGLLEDGVRSALFLAASCRSEIVEKEFKEHQVCFFYLRIGGDVARVELPHWATTPERVNRLHAAIVDQCRRCDGYPRALQEAHELAVISTGDRLQFSRLLEAEASRQGLRAAYNGKQQSKRRRAV